jgi:hypothetical protein
MLQQGFIIALGEPVSAERHDVKLSLEIFPGDTPAVVIGHVRCRVHQVPHYPDHLGIVAIRAFRLLQSSFKFNADGSHCAALATLSNSTNFQPSSGFGLPFAIGTFPVWSASSE